LPSESFVFPKPGNKVENNIAFPVPMCDLFATGTLSITGLFVTGS